MQNAKRQPKTAKSINSNMIIIYIMINIFSVLRSAMDWHIEQNGMQIHIDSIPKIFALICKHLQCLELIVLCQILNTSLKIACTDTAVPKEKLYILS